MRNKLSLSQETIDYAKSLARNIASPIQEFIDKHTTDTVERATLRVLGADGIDTNKVPVPNLAVSSIKEHLSCGATRYYVNAMLKKDISSSELNDANILKKKPKNLS
ncbi:MAG: lysine 5,6-aminomutase subunit alpha TIM-barrel domain-containing protein [Planctomycetota bacterium]